MKRSALKLAAIAFMLAACTDATVTKSEQARPQFRASTGQDVTTGATISTNQDDYLPGEMVHLTGTGWGPGETVHLVMSEEPDTHPDVSHDVTADENGAFSMHFYGVQPEDLGVTFTLVGTGATSGSVVTVVFTDGRAIATFTLNGSLTATVSASSVVTAIVNGQLTGNANNTLGSIGVYVDQSGATGGVLTLLACVDVANEGPSSPSNNISYSRTFGFTAPGTGGVYDVTMQAFGTDGCTGNSDAFERVSALTVGVTNAAPELASIGGKSVVESNVLSFTAAATDDANPAPHALTYSLVNPATGTFPTGATIGAANGVFSWTPSEAQGPGTFRVIVRVSDGALSDEEEIEITVTEGNAAPELGAIGNKNVDELTLLSFSASATDTDLPANTLTYSLGTPDVSCGHADPAGDAITSAGAYTFTPTEAQGPGTYCVRIQVTDGTSTDYEDIVITVNEVNVAPVLGAIGDKSGDELTQISFTASASDADLPVNTLTYSIENAASGTFPTGATISPSSGAFTWTPTEAQGPGTFRVRVKVSDGSLTDFEDIEILVAEVNVAPVLTVPASFGVKWGFAIPATTQASATDADLPVNSLVFSLVGAPAGMTIDGATGVISWTPTITQVGPHVITVRVADNGAPSLFDETPTFTITVNPHATTLTYGGSTTGQYSDKARLSATLYDTDAGAGIAGQSIAFTFAGSAAGSATTSASGVAEVLHTVASAAGSYNVSAAFTATSAYLGATSPTNSFTVAKEDASFTPLASNVGAIPVAQTSLSLGFSVRETNLPPEPQVNDGALAGDINKITTISAVLNGVGSNSNYNGTCTAPAAGSGYATKTFTCTFAGPFAVDAYSISVSVPGSNLFYEGTDEDVISVYDPDAGFVTGGGKFIDTDGLRVSFGMSFTYTGKGKTGFRGGWVVVKHLADGGVCRVKSNTMNAPAVTGNTASLSGKSNYSCVDANGVTTASAGNLAAVGWVQDNGTSGIGQDKFWIAAGAAASALNMTGTPSTTARLLTGGNIQVPQPGK